MCAGAQLARDAMEVQGGTHSQGVDFSGPTGVCPTITSSQAAGPTVGAALLL